MERSEALSKRYTLQGVSKKTLFYEIGTPGGPKTIDRVGDQSKMLSNTLYWVRRTHLPILIPFMDGFPQIMDQNMDHLSRTNSIASEFFIPRFSTMYMKNGPNSICTNFLFQHDKWMLNISFQRDPHCWQCTCTCAQVHLHKHVEGFNTTANGA